MPCRGNVFDASRFLHFEDFLKIDCGLRVYHEGENGWESAATLGTVTDARFERCSREEGNNWYLLT